MKCASGGTRHSRNQKLKEKKGPVNPEKDKEQEEEKLHSFFYKLHDFLFPVINAPAFVPAVLPPCYAIAFVPAIPVSFMFLSFLLFLLFRLLRPITLLFPLSISLSRLFPILFALPILVLVQPNSYVL